MQAKQKRASEKRSKLVTAGTELFHTLGYGGASLADVATHANVPVGGIFYHFRTKADLADAVMEKHHETYAEQLAMIESQTNDPRQRLRLFWDGAAQLADNRAELGCPVLALAEDMACDASRPADAQPTRQRVMRHTIDWLAKQYGALGLNESAAQTAAASLFAAMQGAFAVGHVLGDASLIRDIFQNKRNEQEKAGYL
ncbi:TetR/AcrR family transcriptional regulator [Parasedimentitalea huanghaiensis]|uniref:TetR family transcriptional regulator n=1 Tax=Parasedimentitalea huanghaiensis TaxID=2682100 RepID=A0A6L6WFZ6_9RHOB|nr:TetR/AcrR family transcriptional regulator [Zongyanglinia huanghaiensis]MVO15839.1 TetR family transcriptional regulator [Zongyanglinia huanghaiensis]